MENIFSELSQFTWIILFIYLADGIYYLHIKDVYYKTKVYESPRTNYIAWNRGSKYISSVISANKKINAPVYAFSTFLVIISPR